MNPWEERETRGQERAALLRGVLKFAEQLLELDPWLPFPQNSCCYAFGEESRPLPIGALLLLWERWPACTGPCPACGGQVYGYAFGGLLNIGGVVGCCITCERAQFRRVWAALGEIAAQIRPILRPTPYFLKAGCFGGTYRGPRGPLVAALRSLGAADIPDDTWAKGQDAPGVSFEIPTPEGPVNLSAEVEMDKSVLLPPDGEKGRLWPVIEGTIRLLRKRS